MYSQGSIFTVVRSSVMTNNFVTDNQSNQSRSDWTTNFHESKILKVLKIGKTIFRTTKFSFGQPIKADRLSKGQLQNVPKIKAWQSLYMCSMTACSMYSTVPQYPHTVTMFPYSVVHRITSTLIWCQFSKLTTRGSTSKIHQGFRKVLYIIWRLNIN